MVITRKRLAALAIAPLATTAIVTLAASVNLGWVYSLALMLALYYSALAAAWLRFKPRRDAEPQPAAVPADVEPQLRHVGLLQHNRPAWMVTPTSPASMRTRMLSSFADLGPGVVQASALAARSPQSKDLLAHMATSGAHDWASLESLLIAMAKSTDSTSLQLAIGRIDVGSMTSLALVINSGATSNADREAALAVMRLVVSRVGLLGLSTEAAALLTTLLLRTGRADEAAQVLAATNLDPISDGQLRADAINPFGTSATTPTETWLRAFNRIFVDFGLSPISLTASRTGEEAFDRLSSDTAAATGTEAAADQPLVTVMMAAFKPGREVIAAVRSVVSQTWSNWELLIVDDASGADYDGIFDECAALDSRIRIERREQNSGTYACRNFALTRARGQYMTILDSDDWMHPSRIELQARHLMATPEQLANISYAFRVSGELMFTQDRGVSAKLCEPAMMFRREETMKRVGGFDPVRMGADSEFRFRIGAVQGYPVAILDMLPALTLQRFDTASLSGSDFSFGWQHATRLAYRSAWAHWHSKVLASGATPYRAIDAVHRDYPAPSRISGVARTERERAFDVVFVFDFATKRGEVDHIHDAIADIHQLQSAGLRVAVMHLWHIAGRPPAFQSQHHLLQTLLNSGKLEQVFLAEKDLVVRTAVVREPAIFQFPPAESSLWQPERLLISSEARATEIYVATEYAANAERVFGTTATWIRSADLSAITR